jgi:hypothetical protein
MSGIGRSVAKVAEYGLGQSTADQQNISSALSAVAWSGTATITYSFPTSGAFYGTPRTYPDRAPFNGFGVPTTEQKDDIVRAFELIKSYTKLDFSEITESNTEHAYIRLANTTASATAHAYYPSTSATGGDAFFGTTGREPSMGNFDSASAILHEIGHSMGLKHGQDDDTYGLMNADRRDIEFSLMNYPSYIGATEAFNTAGASPTSYMMYDIAALQYMYGANFSKEGQTVVYKWSETTGEAFIDNVSRGVPDTNTIFETIWTAGATATFDLSNFTQDQVDDMRPGGWMLFSSGQAAHLNETSESKPDGEIYARGNIFNALLFYGTAPGLETNHDGGGGGDASNGAGDQRSLISNLIAGSGNDTVIGNDAANSIFGGNGNDTLTGGGGNDRLDGGDGNDILDGGLGNDILTGGGGSDTIYLTLGNDTLRDDLANIAGDSILGVHSADSLDIMGILFGRSDLAVSRTAEGVTLGIGAVSIELAGDFVGGDFLVAERGAGAAAHTTVTFVSFLPTLTEGRSVDPGSINGIADEAFLTGDGLVQFRMELQSAASAFANTLGFYWVAGDNTIHDVGIAFANTLATAAGSTVSLGAPGDGERLGFFLVQDGFDLFGSLPNDLSFVTAGTFAPADLDDGQPLWLRSATAGVLSAATIFHSFSTLNPGDADQVLSGVAPGGHLMLISFEDLPNGIGDNDFQDVVFGVRATEGGIFIV